MRTVFFGKDGLLRSGWRFSFFLFAYLFVAGILIAAIMAGLSAMYGEEAGAGYLPLLLPFAASALVAIVLGWGAGRIFEDLSFASLGLSLSRRGLADLALGSVIGTAAIGCAVLIGAIGGGLRFELNTASSRASIAASLAFTLVIFAVGALSEEALFRGYLLQTLVRSRLAWLGVILTSVLFALAHNTNPSANVLSTVNTGIAGVWFALAYLKTRNLWFPLGIHLAWNWLQGPVLGINVSGMSQFSLDPLLRAADSGPVLLTGGDYGIEGGIACTVALLIALGVVYFLPVKPRSS